MVFSVAYLCLLREYLFRILWIFHDRQLVGGCELQFSRVSDDGVSVCHPRCQNHDHIIWLDYNLHTPSSILFTNLSFCFQFLFIHLFPFTSTVSPVISIENMWHSGVFCLPFFFLSSPFLSVSIPMLGLFVFFFFLFFWNICSSQKNANSKQQFGHRAWE